MLVVGHSLGGLTVPLIPSRRPVAGLVFVAALLPEPGQVAATALPPEGFSAGFDELLAVAQGDSGWTREAAIAAFYHDVPEPLVTEAVGALRTQEWLPTTQVWPLDAYPDVPMSYVACDDDRCIDPDFQVRSAKVRLGVEAEMLPGSHSPMLARPRELADLLVRYAGESSPVATS